MGNARPLFLPLLLVAALSSFACRASAQEASTVAEGLFRDGITLLGKGKIDAACKKLAESEKLDPSAGTALNLADCRQRQGKTATAWEGFLEAARLAKRQGRPAAVAEAQRRAGLLEPKLSHLRIVLSTKLPGTRVELDAVKLDAAALGSKIPVDPGKHLVAISAPGYQALTMHVEIGAEHDDQTLTVPGLQRKPAEKAPPATAPKTTKAHPAPTPPPDHGPTKASPPIAAYVVGGAGIAALATGGVFVLLAHSAYSDAESQCPSHTSCSQQALDLRSKAELRANVANVGVGVGVAAIAVGTVLLLLHHGSSTGEHPASALVVTPVVSTSGAGLAVQGAMF